MMHSILFFSAVLCRHIILLFVRFIDKVYIKNEASDMQLEK